MVMVREHSLKPLDLTKPSSRTTALMVINGERDRQEELCKAGRFAQTCADPAMPWGNKLACLNEEMGEVATDCLALLGVVEEQADTKKLYVELSQVAAICVAWMECLHNESGVHN